MQRIEYELRVTLPKEIQAALGQGDLSENAEYESAKNRQSTMQARFAQIEKRLADLSRIDVSGVPKDRAGLGSEVTVENLESGEEILYTVVIPELAEATKLVRLDGVAGGEGAHGSTRGRHGHDHDSPRDAGVRGPADRHTDRGRSRIEAVTPARGSAAGPPPEHPSLPPSGARGQTSTASPLRTTTTSSIPSTAATPRSVRTTTDRQSERMTSPNATFPPLSERNSCSELHVPRSLHPTFAGRRRFPRLLLQDAVVDRDRRHPPVRPREPPREAGAVPQEGAAALAIDLGEEVFRQPVGERHDAEKEQPAVPVEAARTEESLRRGEVRLLGEPGDREGAADLSGERFPPLDVPVPRGGMGRRNAEGHEPPRLPGQAKPLPEHGLERPDVADGVVGRGGQDHGVGVLPRDGRRRVRHRGGGVSPLRLQEDVTFGTPRSRWERCGASLTPATTQTRSGGTTGKRRRRVSRIIGPPPVRSRNCFDRRARLSGQKRVPDPPAITTA